MELQCGHRKHKRQGCLNWLLRKTGCCTEDVCIREKIRAYHALFEEGESTTLTSVCEWQHWNRAKKVSCFCRYKHAGDAWKVVSSSLRCLMQMQDSARKSPMGLQAFAVLDGQCARRHGHVILCRNNPGFLHRWQSFHDTSQICVEICDATVH